MPRSLTMFVVGNETPFREKEELGLVLSFLLIFKIQIFSTDNFNCHVLAHSPMHFNAELSYWHLYQLLKLHTTLNRLQKNFWSNFVFRQYISKFLNVYNEQQWTMPLPWIVPLQRSSGSETTFATRMVWLLSERKFLIHLSKHPSMPYCKPLNFRAPFIFAIFAGK